MNFFLYIEFLHDIFNFYNNIIPNLYYFYFKSVLSTLIMTSNIFNLAFT